MKLSIVISCYNEEKSVPLFYKEVEKHREKDFSDLDIEFEYIFVNDGSKDKTLEEIKKLHLGNSNVRYISFSRNFGKEAAMYAGLDASTRRLCCSYGCRSSRSTLSFKRNV